MTHKLAVKALIVNEKGELLVLRRSQSERWKPGIWGLPGGKLEVDEDPYLGLKRETKEETNLEIEVKTPIKVHYFDKEGRMVVLITFLCKTESDELVLNHEHSEFKWVKLEKAKNTIHETYHEDLSLVRDKFR